jgi:DNA-binding IclR family transcriptional regulator
LDILRRLVDAGRPMSQTELADLVGVHQSSVSRILSALTNAGYVRKLENRRFEPDFGVITLASGVTNFPLVRLPRAVVVDEARGRPGILITLSILWRGQILYFLRAGEGCYDDVEFWGNGFPLHKSAPGMRMLLEFPEPEALEILRASRARHGWPRDTAATPVDEIDALRQARELLDRDILILEEWHQPGEFGAATLIDYPAQYPIAISLTGRRNLATDDEVRLWIHEIRRSVEKSLQ